MARARITVKEPAQSYSVGAHSYRAGITYETSDETEIKKAQASPAYLNVDILEESKKPKKKASP